MSIRLFLEDEDLFIDPREIIVERFGHGSIYSTHYCPKCEQESTCRTQLCKLGYTIECLPCVTRQLLEDTEAFAKEAREFLKAILPTQHYTPMGWDASVIDGKLKGLATRASELMKRQDQVKA